MIDLAIQRFDLLGYVKSFGGEEAQSGEWVLDCPVCHKPKLIVNLKKRAYHCWVCQKYAVVQTAQGPRREATAGAGGLIDLIQLLERCERHQAVSRVLAYGFTAKDLVFITDGDFAEITALKPRELMPIDYPPCAKPITHELFYMGKRGITMDDVRRLGLFYCDGGRYQNRLIFPVWDDGKLVYYQGRAMWEPRLGEDYLKAFNPPRAVGAAVSTEVLMGLHHARVYPRVIITEGPVDAIHAGPSAVCSFGKNLSPVQLSRLWGAGVRAIDLMYDPDARSDMEALAPLLATLFDTRLVYLPYGDPGSWPREELQKIVQRGVLVRKRSKLAAI